MTRSHPSRGSAAAHFDQRIAAVRQFNRFYTRQIGVLRDRPYESPVSLTEVRVLYELAHREKPTASELSNDLGLDAGYLSRILTGFDKRGWLEKKPSAADGRQSLLSLTAHGKKILAPLDARSREEVGQMLGGLSAAAQNRLVDAMHTIENLLRRPICTKARLHSSASSAGGYGLGGLPARSALCAGISI